MALTDQRAVDLKTALYRDAVAHNYVEPGFQIWKLVDGEWISIPHVGLPCRKMIETYQKRHALVIDGTFNQQTQDSLIPPPKTTGGQLVANAAHGLIEMAPTTYTQARPFVLTPAAFKAHGTDCSGAAILSYKFAGQPNPNGGAYEGFGNTWSLIARGIRVSTSTAQPGDMTFYGNAQDNPEHVVIELGGGFVMSDGHTGGPLLLRRSYRDDYLQTRRYTTT